MTRSAPAARRFVAALFVIIGVFAFAGLRASAQTSTTTPAATDQTGATAGGGDATSTVGPTTTSTSLPGAVDIGYGYSFTGAAISPIDGTVARRLNAYHAAAFMQSWFAGAAIGSDNQQAQPPGSADVYQVNVTGNWDDQSGTMTVYYASDGKTAWISFPQDQTPSLGPYTPPLPADWAVAPDGTIDGFNGKGTVTPPLGITDPTDPSAPLDEATDPVDDGGDNGTSLTWVWLALGATVIAAVAVSLWLRRGDEERDEPDPPQRRVMARAKVRSNSKQD
jgi:hypothetical protein